MKTIKRNYLVAYGQTLTQKQFPIFNQAKLACGHRPPPCEKKRNPKPYPTLDPKTCTLTWNQFPQPDTLHPPEGVLPRVLPAFGQLLGPRSRCDALLGDPAASGHLGLRVFRVESLGSNFRGF